MLKRLLKTAAR